MANHNNRAAIIILAIVVAMGLIFVPGAGFSYAVSVSDFKDVAGGYWGYSYINFAAEKGIINGYQSPDGTYRFLPENSLTREESVTMLYRTLSAAGKLKSAEDFTADYTGLFETCKIAEWARKYVAYGLKYKLVSEAELDGFTDENGTGIPAPREQVAAWTAKAMEKNVSPAYSLIYTDKDSISADKLAYVDLLYRQGIMQGDDTKMFHPSGNIKRAEFAAISKRVFESFQSGAYTENREIQSYRGTIVSTDIYNSKIMLTQSDGTARVIQINPKTQIVIDGKVNYNGLAGIGTGTAAVIAWGAFHSEGSSDNSTLQLQITTKTQTRTGLLKEVNKMDGSTSVLKIENEDGDPIYYVLDAGSKTDGTPKKGTEVTFIADGIKILEMK